MSYDRALTVFSPDGHLIQVEYAQEAARKGNAAVGVVGKTSVVLAVERKSAQKLQDNRTMRKICMLDDHVYIAFAGLWADARVLIQKAQVDCQSFTLNYDDKISVEQITKYVGEVQQKYTQRGGARPFGVSTIVAGVDMDGTPGLYQTDPAGIVTSWKACNIGRNGKTITELLEKSYSEDSMDTPAITRLAVKALLEVVEGGGKNIEVVVVEKRDGKCGGFQMPDNELEALVTSVEAEREEELEKRRKQLLDE